MNARPLPALPQRYPLAPPWPWGVVLWIWLPLLAAAGLVVYLDAPGLQAGHLRSWLHAGGFVAIALACACAHARRRIDLREGSLEVRSTLFTRRVPVSAMRLEATRLVDLAEHTELAPGLRKIGFGYPGFRSGHYRLRNGQDGFCLLTRSNPVLAIALRDGGWLLLSPEHPRQLLEDLRRLAAHPA